MEQLVEDAPVPLVPSMRTDCKEEQDPSGLAVDGDASETRSACYIDDTDDGDELFNATSREFAKASSSDVCADSRRASPAAVAVEPSEASEPLPFDAHEVEHSESQDHEDGDTHDAPQASSIMNFDAFVSGDWSLPSQELSLEALDGEDDAESESDANTLGTPDDDDNADVGFVDAFDSECDDNGDESESTPRASAPRPRGVSLGAISSIRNAAVAVSAAKLVRVKEKTQQVAQSKKQALSNFQKKGGLVGWLHGEPSEDSIDADVIRDSNSDGTDDDGGDEDASDAVAAPAQGDDPLRSASLPSESPAAVSEARHHRSFPTVQSLHDDAHSTSRQSTMSSPAASGFLKKSLGSRERASSLLGNLYGKVKKSASPAATPPSTPTPRSGSLAESSTASPSGRVALQPSPRKGGAANERYSFGFDEYASSCNSSGDTSSTRRRTVSVDSSLQRGLSAQHRDEMAVRPLLLNECLADPKLAAEFVNTVMPTDSALLKLLYSIEEYETLVTSEPTPALAVQLTYATTVVDKFLVASSSMAVSVLSKLPANTAADLKLALEQHELTNAPALPKALFQDVYAAVYDALRAGFEAFKFTREYALLAQQQHEQLERHSSSSPVLTIDAILANEWCSTVFWMYLYRTLHHNRLSFVMDKAFKLDKMYATLCDALEDCDSGASTKSKAFERLTAQLQLVARKFLVKTAPVALPVTAEPLCRLKEEICLELEHLPSQLERSPMPHEHGDASDPLAVLERVMSKLDTLADGVKQEFKRLSFERFASFTASALYRDFVALLLLPSAGRHAPGSDHVSDARCSRGDIVQLLRASRIPFHQAPNDAPPTRDLSCLFRQHDDSPAAVADTSTPALSAASDSRGLASDAIHKVFSFVKRDSVNASGRLQPFDYTDLTRAAAAPTIDSGTEDEHASLQLLYQTAEHFLLPEAASRTFELAPAAAHQSLCYNFVAGNGEHAVYGAVWRLPLAAGDSVSTQGICVVSKYPLVDALRRYLQRFAQSWSAAGDLTELQGRCAPDWSTCGVHAFQPALEAANIALEQHLACQHQLQQQGDVTLSTLRHLRPPPVDVALDDLFDCLSLPHILRLVALVLLEKKIVLVASSYSVLLSVGEALKALVFPLVWSHVYVPVLPLALKGYLHCPTPFIFGLHTSYARSSDIPRPSDDLVVVNLDRDALVGGGTVELPPTRYASLLDKLVRICRPQLHVRDCVEYTPPRSLDITSNIKNSSSSSSAIARQRAFPSDDVRSVFYDELRDLLAGLEAFAFRFEFNGTCVAVADASNRSRAWPADASAFLATLLQTQAFSVYVSTLPSL